MKHGLLFGGWLIRRRVIDPHRRADISRSEGGTAAVPGAECGSALRPGRRFVVLAERDGQRLRRLGAGPGAGRRRGGHGVCACGLEGRR